MINNLKIPNKSFLWHITLQFSFSLMNYKVVHSFQFFNYFEKCKIFLNGEKFLLLEPMITEKTHTHSPIQNENFNP